MNKAVKICIFNKNTPKETVILSNGDAILDNICTSCKVTENLDGTYGLDAEFIIDDDGLWEYLQEEAILKIKVDYGDEYFRITKPRKTRNRIIIYAIQVTIYETIHLWLNDVRPTGLNGTAAINWILDGAVGVKELEVYSNISESNTAYYEDMNMYKAIHDCDQSFLNRWGGEIQRRGYLLKILDKVGKDRGVQIRSCKNLKGFEANTDVDSITTRIKPKGYDGITINGFIDSPILNNYARAYTKEFTYSDVKVKSSESETEGFNTLEEAQAELKRLAQLEYTENNVDIISADYTIDFVDLSQTEEYKNYIKAEKVYIGDEVSVFESKLNINVVVRAIERKYNVLTQKVEEIKLSNKDIGRKSINDVMIDISKDIEKNDNSIEKWIQSFINSGIKDSYVFYNKEELVVCDSPTIEEAIHVWRFNKNGLAHSANGYQGPYDVALTANGQINANMILAGTLKGQYIDARNMVIKDEDGNVTFSVGSDAIVRMIQGLIDISDEGIRINLIDSEDKILGYVLYDGQGVQIFTQTDESISHLTREGSYIDNLVVKHIKCSELFKIANHCGCSLDWYIADKATGDGTGRDEENKANSLKDVLRTIRNYGLKFTDVLNIYVESGILNEQIVIQDFEGTQINIIVSAGVVINTDKFVIEDCGARLNIKAEVTKRCLATDITADDINKRALIKTSDSNYAIVVSNSSYVKISGFRIRGAGGSCIKTYEKGNVILEDCDISNFDYAMYADEFSMCCLNGCRGNVKQLAYTANIAPFSSTSNIPKCTEASSNDELVDRRQSGYWIKENVYTQYDTLYKENSSTGDTGSGESSSTPSTNITDNFVLNSLYTKVEGSGKSNTDRNGYTGQGRFKTYQAHRGYIILPSAQIIASIQAKKDYEVRLSMTRLNSEHGYDSKTPHPIIRAVGSGIETDYWDCGIKFARGETNVITLPDSIKNAIAEGATQLELWAETEQEKQYSFYNNISLIVEGQNKTGSSESSGGGSSGGGSGGSSSEETDLYSDFTYADELVETAMTYYRVCDEEFDQANKTPWSQGFTYRASNTPMSGNCVAEQDVTNSLWVAKTDTKGNTRHYKAIDCSTGVNMWLRHIIYEKSPYKNETLFNAFRANILQKNDESKWAIVPTRSDGKAARYAYEICNYFYRMNKGITYLKDPDTGKVIKGSIGTEADNYSKIKKGYIVFHAKKDATGEWKRPKATEFMHVSHTAICYGQSNTYNANSIIESTNVTTKKHTMTDGVTTLNAGMRIDKISKYADDIVMVVNPEAFLNSSSSGGSSGGSTETTGKEEYTNCFNMSGTINGHNYIYKLQNCKITGYGGDSGSACNIPLSLAKTCGSFNLPYGTKVYIASMDGRTITDGNGKSVKSDGVFTINDTGVGCTDFDLYVSTKSDSDAEKVFKNTLREDVYILSYGSGYGYAWSYTQSYKWAYNNGTLSAYKVAFKDYIKYGGTLINFIKFKNDDANIRSSTYWSILNS